MASATATAAFPTFHSYQIKGAFQNSLMNLLGLKCTVVGCELYSQNKFFNEFGKAPLSKLEELQVCNILNEIYQAECAVAKATAFTNLKSLEFV